MTPRHGILLAALCALVPGPLHGQQVTSPLEAFGHELGADYMLVNYQQIADYWRTLDAQSDRIVLRDIGRTAEGRQQLMAIVTSPENHRRLERYREIAQSLARAEGVTEQEARALAKEGKAVVWIDGGLHASETLGAQQLAETVYRMVSGTDDETMRILDDVIILFVHANPDGNDFVADWYMRRDEPGERSLAALPRLYQKYIGHDNNRDFFASTQAETENMNRVLYHEWFPQVLYNHHQSGPAGTVVWSPPLRDPYNYNLHPMLVLGFQSLGAAMHTRLAAENKPGATMRSGGPYDGWWNGGIRNTAAFHNTIAMLTEMIGNPTPMRIPFVERRQLPSADLAYPIDPQQWHLRQSVEYSVSLNYAVLDYASRMRENLLYNIWVMGNSSIQRGSGDWWTINPKRLASVSARFAEADLPAARRDSAIMAELRSPELRDPRGYIIPSDQKDFGTATKFINALRETGITVQRATRAFNVNGRSYPAGSFVVKSAQAFRPHVIDMFEPQVHPDVFPVPDGPPTPPYDNAGWTLALQMGVEFDRILDGFDGPFEPVTDWNVAMPQGRVVDADGARAFLLKRDANNAFIAVNRLHAAGVEMRTLLAPATIGGRVFSAGTFVASADARRVDSLAGELGIEFTGAREMPRTADVIRPRRIGLWDRYGGSMDSGWTRWILEQFEFPFTRVFARELDAGDLNTRYDVLVFVDGAIPDAAAERRAGGSVPDDIPAEYREHVGNVTHARTLPQLRTFAENGGTIVAVGSSAENLAAYLDLPIESHLVENGRALPRTKYYVPGSLLRARVDTTHALAHGATTNTTFYFDNSPVFRLGADAEARGVKAIAWFESDASLVSGWAWGQQYLKGGVAGIEARVGRGRVILYGPEILKRAQPHGTFRFLFNALQ